MWAVVFAILALDVFTKWLAVHWLAGIPDGYQVLPVFSLNLVFNSGISFGLLKATSTVQTWALCATTLVAIAGLTWMAWKSETLWERAGYGLILGGAIGNVLDRLHDGVVTDFLDFHIWNWRYPTFNFADVAITLGVATLLLTLATPASSADDDARSM